VPARGTANGTATWGYGGYGYGGYYPGYGYGGYYGYGYGCWGYPYWGWPTWSVGLYGGWGWPYYGDYYGGPYVPYGDGYTARLAPDPNTPAVVVTRLAPSKAEVLLDGVSVGYTKDYDGRWDSLTIAPGRHTLTFRADGYTTRIVEIDARPGASLLFHDDLKRGEGEERQALPPPTEEPRAAAPAQPSSSVAQGRLKIHVQPDDAAVYLDGEYLGMAGELARLHGSIPVATGRHQLEVVRPGFATSVTSVYVTGEDIADARVSLVAAP
jgi:hypothetical protein